ncbi:MAG: tRNA (N6-isopentenyl adenosine(37)-C2)-methylthiotransferase MiaB [Planctomycetota bacterium]
MNHRIYLETFGCQMNKLDSEGILSGLLRKGWTLADERDDADVILFNTCSVRDQAENRVHSQLGTLRAVKRARPGLVIGIVGCMAQRMKGQLLSRYPHLDLVAGTHQFKRVPDFVEDILRERRRTLAVEETDHYDDPERHPSVRSSAFQAWVLAMKGCNLACSFCVVPRTRGREVSRPIEEIVREVGALASQGVREVTLLGQTIDAYGIGLSPRRRLSDLLAALQPIEGIERIRFITSHPSFVTPDLMDAMRDLPKVCPYVHMPPQSGSDQILKEMRRGYTVAKYRDIVARLRETVPGAEVAADWIVGYPGETEGDFAASVALLEETRFQQSFVFKYSVRPDTPAAGIPDAVPDVAKRERNQALLDAQRRVSEEKNRTLVGSEVEVLVEGPSESDPTRQAGRDRQNRIVVVSDREDLTGKLVRVQVTHATPLTLFAEVAREGRPGEPLAALSDAER